MITADTITNEQIRELRDSLPEVTESEFRAGGVPHSPARIRRICHAALGCVEDLGAAGALWHRIHARKESHVNDDFDTEEPTKPDALKSMTLAETAEWWLTQRRLDSERPTRRIDEDVVERLRGACL